MACVFAGRGCRRKRQGVYEEALLEYLDVCHRVEVEQGAGGGA